MRARRLQWEFVLCVLCLCPLLAVAFFIIYRQLAIKSSRFFYKYSLDEIDNARGFRYHGKMRFCCGLLCVLALR